MRILTWPGGLPEALSGLHERVAEGLDARLVPIDAPAQAVGSDADALLAVPDAAVAAGAGVGDVAEHLRALGEEPGPDLVLVLGDGYLGTDVDRLGAAALGAVGVATVRSIAVRQDPRRANAVCVPEALVGPSGELRGPLRAPVDVHDVADAAVFLLGRTGRYLSGQVLFVDGGRHLFSSMTA